MCAENSAAEILSALYPAMHCEIATEMMSD